MRLKIYGIPRIALFLFGVLPGFVGLSFHHEFLHYRSLDTVWFTIVSLSLALTFYYFFLNGVFRIRYLILTALAVQIVFELMIAVMDRSFPNLGFGILVFTVAAAISIWFERRVNAACLNPQTSWYEGDPRTYPKVSLKIGEGHVAKIRLIDEEGFFVFLKGPIAFRPLERLPFELQYKNFQISGEARITASFIGEKIGFGLQFSPKDLYHFNQYTALVQRLRGEGLST